MLWRWATCAWLLLAAAPSAWGQDATAPLERVTYQLPNGLRVILAPEPGATLLLAVSYAGGQAADPPAYPGLAHLAEHATFRGSRHLRAFEGPKLIEALGGGWTAVTMPERTLYLAALPARGLETGLWLESERMAFSAAGLTAPALRLEQQIVRHEHEERSHTREMLIERHVERVLFGDDRLGALIDGEADAALADVTLPGMQGFMQRMYRPDNATLALLGAFDPAAVQPLIQRYFGTLRNPGVARAQARQRTPRLCGVHRVELGHPYLLGHSIALLWPLPVASAAETSLYEALRLLVARTVSEALEPSSFQVASLEVTWSRHETHALLRIDVELYRDGLFTRVEEAIMSALARLQQAPMPADRLARLQATLRSQSFPSPGRQVDSLLALLNQKDRSDAPLDSTILQLKAAALTTGSRLVLTAKPNRSAGVLHEVDPCR